MDCGKRQEDIICKKTFHLEIGMYLARVLKQMNLQSNQALPVNQDKLDCAPKQQCTCFKTSLTVLRDKYTRGSRIMSRAYDSRTLRTKRTIESSQNFLIQFGI